VQPGQQATPATIIGSLLDGHPHASVLLAEACHCRALAKCSEADAEFRFRAAQVARLAYEELRHRLDPRRRRPVDFGAGLLGLLVLAAALAALDLVELSGLPGELAPVSSALAATVVWLALGWLGAVAARQRRWAGLTVIAAAAASLGLLLMALYGFAPHPGWPPVGQHLAGSTIFGILAGMLILLLTAAATVLIARLEPVGLLPARRRWRRACDAYEEAVDTSGADEEADAIATRTWLGLAQAWAIAIVPGEEQLIANTVDLAAVMINRGNSQ
jgi:hypothetical protein